MDEKTSTGITFDTFFEEVFNSRPANDVLAAHAGDRPPDRLYGELWREGEIAVLFGEAGTGKSVVATQIGAAIAAGNSGNEKFKVEGGRRKVLYFDLKLSERQWSERYSDDIELTNGGKRPFERFPAGFHRVEVNMFARTPDEQTNFGSALGSAIGELARKKKAGVVIIDNINMLRHSNDFTRDMLPLIRELRRLKREMGLSILVVAQSQPRHDADSLELRDLKSARVLYNFADSVFGLGRSYWDGIRYLKQVKSGSGEVLFVASHIPVFKIEKVDGKFLGLTWMHYSDESTVRTGVIKHPNWGLINRAKALHDEGSSFREIATVLGVTRMTAHRLVQRWTPPVPDPRSVPKPKPEPEATLSEADDPEPEQVICEPVEHSEVPYADEPPVEPDEIDPFNGFPPCGDPERYNGLTHMLDDYDKDIWVEKFREDGRPMSWFYYNSRRRWCRADRDGWGTSRKCLEPWPRSGISIYRPETEEEDSS